MGNAITAFFTRTAARYRDAFAEDGFIFSALASIIVFACALYVNFWAIKLATEHASNAVTDLVLSNIPVYDVDVLFVYGTFLFIVFSVCVVAPYPRRIPFVFQALTLFILVRSGFTLLTHLGPPEARYASDFNDLITRAFYGADQFFSGHTGMVFLGALAFWDVPWIRNTLLAGSFYFAVVVLIGHIHYSIDVASAFFITYGIYQIAKYLLPNPYREFANDIERERV